MCSNLWDGARTEASLHWDFVEKISADSIDTNKAYKGFYKLTKNGGIYYACFDDFYNYDILEILATVPTHRESAFEQAMAAIKNPDIRPAAEADNEPPEAVAQRIASLI